MSVDRIGPDKAAKFFGSTDPQRCHQCGRVFCEPRWEDYLRQEGE